MNLTLPTLTFLFSWVVISVFISCSGQDNAIERRAQNQTQATPPTPPKVMESGSLDPAEWKTLAETSNFQSTSNHAQTMAFLERLKPHLPQMKLGTFGNSAKGRELPLVILGKAHSKEEAAALELPIVLIQNAIHPGEVDGKDACLMLLRDLALGKRHFILDAAVLLIIPIYNVDGHERVSPHNRPNQNGPFDGMGFRATTQGLDLNRDHVKLVSPEARALVALFNEWRPHLHIDVHVTDGSDHDWVLTYMAAEKPQLAVPIHDWVWQHLPEALGEIEKLGHRNGPYVWLNDRNDPGKGFTSNLGPPRLSTSYFAMRNRPSILVETHSFKPFKSRVLATLDFLVEILKQVRDSGAELVAATDAAQSKVVALGRPDAPPSKMVLSYRTPKEPDSISLPIYKYTLEPSILYGTPIIKYETGVVDEMEVSWFHGAEPDVVLERPRGYFVENGWPVVEGALRAQGIEIYRLVEPIEWEVETIRIKDPKFAGKSYQGEIRTDVTVERQLETRPISAGTLWIPADQPDFETAAQLLEPEAPDSLVSWGMLSGVLEHKTYISPRVLENQIKVLIRDPEIQAAWNKALKNKDFASNRRARLVWWYSQTKYWDDHVGLMPAMRVLKVPDMVVERYQPVSLGDFVTGVER